MFLISLDILGALTINIVLMISEVCWEHRKGGVGGKICVNGFEEGLKVNARGSYSIWTPARITSILHIQPLTRRCDESDFKQN